MNIHGLKQKAATLRDKKNDVDYNIIKNIESAIRTINNEIRERRQIKKK
jgi:hypothetical protein